jgi:ribosomal protein S18 acetylase RimI-like enzyme
MLPKAPGFHKVIMGENLQQLFDFDTKVTKASPYILPFETSREFLNFFTIEHKSDTYIYNDDKGNLVGIFSVIYFSSENTMELLSIMIDPVFQKHGYGKKIMLFVEDLANKTGITKMKLVTNIKNISAIGFYKSIGYKIIKKVKNYYGDGETRYVFEKMINNE